jgi:hypothetical protein
MGQNASGAWIQAGSAFAGIGNTVAIGHVLYDSSFPIVPADNLWVPARENPAPSPSFRSETSTSSSERQTLPPLRKLISGGSVWLKPPYGPISSWIRGRNHLIWDFPSYPGLDLETNPTQPALEVEEVLEDRYESAMGNLALETPQYCLVSLVGTTSGSASNGDGSLGESILEALNESGELDDWDSKGYDSDE